MVDHVASHSRPQVFAQLVLVTNFVSILYHLLELVPVLPYYRQNVTSFIYDIAYQDDAYVDVDVPSS